MVARQYIASIMPPAIGIDTIEQKGAVNADIIRAIEKNYPEAVKLSESIANQFKGHSAKQTAYNIYKFLREQITYLADPDHKQKIRLPNRFISDATGDCKSFALFTASILANLEMPIAFRFASYNPFNNTPSHVYVVTKDEKGRELIIDGVYKLFNAEKPYSYKTDCNMTVYTLSGVGDNNFSIDDINNYREQIKRQLKSILISAKEKNRLRSALARLNEYLQSVESENMNADPLGKVTAKGLFLAPSRNAFLALVGLNVRGLAHKLAYSIYKNEASTRAMWEKLGGDFSKLKATVEKAKNKAPLFGEKDAAAYNIPVPFSEVAPNPILYNSLAEANAGRAKYKIGGIGLDPASGSAVGTFIAAAAPVIASVAAFLAKVLNKDTDSDFSALLEDAQKLGGDTNAIDDGAYVADAESGSIIPGVPNLVLFGAGGLLALKLLKII